MKEGKILEQAVSLSELKLSEIVEKSSISKSQMYNLYKMDEIGDDYKAKLKRAGISPDWSPKSAIDRDQKGSQLDVALRLLTQTVVMLRENHETFSRIINSALDDGRLRFDDKVTKKG